jgi:hypothetical protein
MFTFQFSYFTIYILAQQSADVEPVSGISEEGPTTFQGDISTIPQASESCWLFCMISSVDLTFRNYVSLTNIIEFYILVSKSGNSVYKYIIEIYKILIVPFSSLEK